MRTQTQKTQDSTRAKLATSQRSSMAQYSHPVLKLQNQIGNQAVQRLLQSRHIQAKFTVGAPNDKYEQEADSVADQVMRMPDPVATEQSDNNLTTPTPVIQRVCNECEEELQRQPTDENAEEEEDKLLQAKEMPGQTPEVGHGVESTINNLRGAGQALSPSDRSFFEPRFGQSFSQVRIHTDAKAADTAKTVNARAFTLGQDIVFGAGEFSSSSSSGRRLLAHELTHVVQQNSDCHTGSIQRLVLGDVTALSISPTWAHALTDTELQEQIYLLRGHLEGLGEADPERAPMLANLGVLEHEVMDRQVPTGPTGDRLVNEWLGLNAGQHLSSDRAWVRGQWPVGGALATLNAPFRIGVQALLNFVAATPTAQFNIFSYARSAPKQHVMHVGQYIRKGWMGYARYKFSRWPGVLAAGGRTNLLALPTHERRSRLRGILNPEILSIVWDTGTPATSRNHGTRVAEMYHIGINNPVANGGAAYAWPTGNTTTSRHGSGNAVDAGPAQLPNVATIRQNQAHTWPTLASLQAEMGAANIQVVAATATLPVGYKITGLSNVNRRDAFLHLFFQVRSAARAGFVDLAHFQAP